MNILNILNPIRGRGMADVAWEGFSLASQLAKIDLSTRADHRVVQAEGDAPASAGYHHSDGILLGHSYTAAADFSIKGLTHTQIATWLEWLALAGWVAFFRNWPGNEHIHANYCGLPQKRQLDGQNEDFFAGRDGLVGHRRINDEFWYPELAARRIPETLFGLSNPKSGAGQIQRSPLALKMETPAPVAEDLPTKGLYLGSDLKPRFWMPVVSDVAWAPVRAFGAALGFDTEYHPDLNQITYDGQEVPIALRLFAGVGHAPVRQLVREVGLSIGAVEAKRVQVVRA